MANLHIIVSKVFGEEKIKTLKPECRHVESMVIVSRESFPLKSFILSTLCRKIASSFLSSKEGATRNMSLLP